MANKIDKTTLCPSAIRQRPQKISAISSTSSYFSWSSAVFSKLSFLAATFAKLREGRTFVGKGGFGIWLDNWGEVGVWGVDDERGGVLVRWSELRSEAVRELVRDIDSRSLIAPRSFSRRSATSFSRVVTSTGLQSLWLRQLKYGRMVRTYFAAPKGLDRGVLDTEGVGPTFGEDKGLGLADTFPERGRSSNFRRLNCGVGGVELLARQSGQSRSLNRSSAGTNRTYEKHCCGRQDEAG